LKTHLFGEMDLDLSKGPGKVYDDAFEIAENCGYGITIDTQLIELYGSDGERVSLHYDHDGKLIRGFTWRVNDNDVIIETKRRLII